MRVYVASSWRNGRQQEVVRVLRESGHEVYDFREPEPGNCGFSWHQLDASLPVGPVTVVLPARNICEMLAHPIADAGFALDMNALRWCEACVLVLPCGRSAHLEAGWAAGAGKLTIGLLDDGEPDLMWKMLDRLAVSLDEVSDLLREMQTA
jgi:hypothetical protein